MNVCAMRFQTALLQEEVLHLLAKEAGSEQKSLEQTLCVKCFVLVARENKLL